MTDPDSDHRRRMGIPDRRKNTYEELERRLDEHIDKIEMKFGRWFRRGLVIIALIGLCCAIALGGVYFVLGELEETRATFTRTECENTNSRNEDTSNQIIALAGEDEEARKTEAAKAEVRRRRDVTLALIDALQPVKDCDYQVALSIGEATPTPTPTPIPSPTIAPTETP